MSDLVYSELWRQVADECERGAAKLEGHKSKKSKAKAGQLHQEARVFRKLADRMEAAYTAVDEARVMRLAIMAEIGSHKRRVASMTDCYAWTEKASKKKDKAKRKEALTYVFAMDQRLAAMRDRLPVLESFLERLRAWPPK